MSENCPLCGKPVCPTCGGGTTYRPIIDGWKETEQVCPDDFHKTAPEPRKQETT
jgi:hypothetical protein